VLSVLFYASFRICIYHALLWCCFCFRVFLYGVKYIQFCILRVRRTNKPLMSIFGVVVYNYNDKTNQRVITSFWKYIIYLWSSKSPHAMIIDFVETNAEYSFIDCPNTILFIHVTYICYFHYLIENIQVHCWEMFFVIENLLRTLSTLGVIILNVIEFRFVAFYMYLTPWCCKVFTVMVY
jgi:hypothetical protein